VISAYSYSTPSGDWQYTTSGAEITLSLDCAGSMITENDSVKGMKSSVPMLDMLMLYVEGGPREVSQMNSNSPLMSVVVLISQTMSA